jgi:hypothetical protein
LARRPFRQTSNAERFAAIELAAHQRFFKKAGLALMYPKGESLWTSRLFLRLYRCAQLS